MKDKTKEIYDILLLRFGDAKCELNFKNNFELIVSVVLSARCTDKRVNLITPALFEKYPTAKELALAHTSDVEKIIYSCGFYKNKTRNLIALSQDLVTRFGGVVPEDYDDLVSLAGVGRKTANVVTSVGFLRPAIAVDTHVFRVANRLAIVRAKSPLECEQKLQKLFPRDKWGKLHSMFVLFGRYVCKSRAPECQSCELKEYCKYYSEKYKKVDK